MPKSNKNKNKNKKKQKTKIIQIPIQIKLYKANKNINRNIYLELIKKIKIVLTIFFFILFNIFIILIYKRKFVHNSIKHEYNIKKIENYYKLNKTRIGVISVNNDLNPGNNLVKFSIFTILKEYGFEPIIIATNKYKTNSSFLYKTVKFKEIKNSFSWELKEQDYDILMVNSDQTWTYSEKKYFYDVAFLRFAQNWKVPKFVYGASMGIGHWFYSKRDDDIAKSLLINFSGISLREKAILKLAEVHLNIKPSFVLDPTFLLDKSYYLNLIKDYNRDFNFNEKYIFFYQLDYNRLISEFIKEVSEKLNYKIYKFNKDSGNYVENFIFGMNISQAVITDSYHGTVFSIIFNKPFISYINTQRGRSRFESLSETFNLVDRIIYQIESINKGYKLLLEPLNINRTLLNELKNSSLNFLKKNLGLLE